MIFDFANYNEILDNLLIFVYDDGSQSRCTTEKIHISGGFLSPRSAANKGMDQ